MTGLDVEAVLRDHYAVVSGDEDGWHVVCTCGHDERGTDSTAHVAAVLRVEIESALADVLRDAADEIRRRYSPNLANLPHIATFYNGGVEDALRVLTDRADQIDRASLAATEGDRQ